MKRIRLTVCGWLAGGLVSLLLSLSAFAQTASTGALTGIVTDNTGAVVPAAKVVLTNETTGENRTVTTQANGSFTVPLLLPGSYRVEFSITGFKQSVKSGLAINVTETSRLDVQLEVGGVQEQVTISADAVLLQTESSALGRVTDRELVSNLPLVTRNYTQIVMLSPGIAAGVTNAAEIGRGSSGESGGNFRTHGAFGRDNNFQMNGLPINDLQASGGFSGGVAVPNPDAIEQFKVQTGQYDASFGRNAGANVNVVTKSGTNQFHGSVFEFFRNDVLNANEFFRNATGQKRGVLKQNQFGFTLGGPIVKDKLFFFGSYQGTRQRNGVGGGGAVTFFSPALTNDRSRAALGSLFAGQAGAFGGVAVAADGSNISAPAFALLNMKLPNGQYLIPTPQTINPAQPFARRGFSAFSSPAVFDEDQFVINLDYVMSDRSKLAGRFFYADSDQSVPFPTTNLGGPAAPGFPVNTSNRLRNFSVAHTFTVNSRLINQAEFGFFRNEVATRQTEIFKFSDIGVTAPAHANPYPAIAITGALTLGGNGQEVVLPQQHFTFQDSLTYVRGRHSLRFGGGYTRSHLDIAEFHFLGGLIFQSFPDFLLGLPAASNGSPLSNVIGSIDIPGELNRTWRVNDTNLFVQDDFKLAPSFTLNLGLRYERIGNLRDIAGRNSGFDVAAANPTPPAAGTVQGYVVSKGFSGTVPAGVVQLDNNLGIRGDNQNNYGPRVGFAWQMPGASRLAKRLVMRGGYGMYFSRATGQPFLQLVSGPPFAQVRQLVAAPNAAASFANPFGPAPVLPSFPAYSPTTQRTLVFVEQGYRPPVTQQYSLNLQSELGRNFLLEVGYVGSRGTHLILSHSLNQAALASASSPIRGVTTNTVANVAQRVPIQGFTAPGLTAIDSFATSRYNALEVSVTKRMAQGLQFLAAYTFARAFSDGATNTAAAGTGGLAGNQNNRRANYGLADFNREHRFVFSYVYQLPRPKKINAFVDGLLGGWSVAGVTTIQTGTPLSFTGTNTNNVFGITNDRAQLAAGCTYENIATSGSTQSRLGGYFNRTCFNGLTATGGAPAWQIIGDDNRATNFGNSGPGILTGPGQNSSDIALVKRTPLRIVGESGNIEFRTEFFNAFNHAQFSNPSTNVSNSAFGTITSTSVNPRIIQFALKLNF